MVNSPRTGRRLAILGAALLAALLVSIRRPDRPLPFYGRPLIQQPCTVRREPCDTIQAADRIRIATYNLQDFTDGVDDGTDRTTERAEHHARLAALIIAEMDPDVLVLQEIENANALSLLLEKLHYSYPLAYLTDFGEQGGRPLNIAVVSRIPLADLRELDFAGLSGPGRPPRGVLSFTLELDPGRRLLVYAVHLKSNFGDPWKNRSKRYHALRLIRRDACRFVRRHPQYAWETMLLGDMNVDPELPQFARDCSLRPVHDWIDLWRGVPPGERVTLPTRHGDPEMEFPPAAFDRFIVSPQLVRSPWTAAVPHVLRRGVDTGNVFAAGGDNDIHVSDHYPVFLDLHR